MNRDPRVEGQIRRLLLAFPWRFRLEHGQEIVGTTLDTVPADARRLPLATAVDLVRGGHRVRRQNQPPLPSRIAYRFGARLHPRWLRWVYDDVEDPRYVCRARRDLVLLLGVLGTASVALAGPSTMGGLIGLLLIGLTRWQIERTRHRIRATHGLVPGGVNPYLMWVRRRSRPLVPDVSAAPVLLVAGLQAVGLGLAALWALDRPNPITMTGPDLTLRSATRPSDELLQIAPRYVGGAVLLALLVAAASAWKAQRRRVVPSQEADAALGPRSTSWIAAVASTAVIAVAGAAVTVLLWLTWWPWHVGLGLVMVGAAGLVSVLAGGALAIAGRVRGRAVGLWSVLPWLGPRESVLCVSVWVASAYPVEDRWVVGGPPQPA